MSWLATLAAIVELLAQLAPLGEDLAAAVKGLLADLRAAPAGAAPTLQQVQAMQAVIAQLQARLDAA